MKRGSSARSAAASRNATAPATPGGAAGAPDVEFARAGAADVGVGVGAGIGSSVGTCVGGDVGIAEGASLEPVNLRLEPEQISKPHVELSKSHASTVGIDGAALGAKSYMPYP